MRSERVESGGEGALHELIESPGPRPAAVGGEVARGLSRAVSQSRLVVALALIAAGVVWAFARGVHYYGFGFANLIYDLDQPPLLLVYVAAWLLYRSLRR